MRPDRNSNRIARLFHWLETPVDNTFLAMFRMAFGLLISLDMGWHFAYGFIRDHYIAPTHHFTYYGFSWIQPWPAPLMYAHFGLVGLSGLMIALGWHFRLASIIFFAGFGYLFLIDQTLYLNHNYLILIIGFLLMLLPAHRVLSLDARSGRAPASDVAPRWTLWILRLQIGIVYFFGGIAKINPDWLRGEPLRMWLEGRRNTPVIGPWLDSEFAVYFFSYGGLLYDLFIVPLLLWRRTRPLAVLMCFFFHLTNATLFDIGIFPWMMLAMTFLYFPPEQIAGWFRRRSSRPGPTSPVSATPRIILLLLAVHLCGQCLMPLRHWLYPGDVTWSEEGHRFSWRMKLRSKQGWLTYRLVDPVSGKAVDIPPQVFATSRQASRMSTRPDMILQGAHWLADRYEQDAGIRPRVFARSYCSLNGRSPRPLIEPSVDLAAQERTLRHAAWITPYIYTPVPRTGARQPTPTIVPWTQVMHRTPDTPVLRDEVINRLVAQQARRLDRINAELLQEFGIISDRYYSVIDRSIVELTPKSGMDLSRQPVDVDSLSDLRRYFDMREHRMLRSKDELDRYEMMATRKAMLSIRLEQLAAMVSKTSPGWIEQD